MRDVKGKKNKGSLVLKISLFCFVCFFVVSLIDQQMQISEKEAQLDQVTAEREMQDRKNEELEKALQSNEGIDTYAEDYARREYGFAKSDERVFINIGGLEADD